MNLAQLWQQMLEEVATMLEQDPSLQSFLHNSLMSHNDFSQALVANLAEQLGSDLVSQQELVQAFNQQLLKHPEITDCAAADILACYQRDPACDRLVMPLLYFKGYRALQTYRFAHSLWQDGQAGLARYLQGRCSELFSVDIHPSAVVGSGILLDHATGVVIGETTVIEDDVSILHSVTLGGTGNEAGDRHPKIKRGVLIAAGAKVLGNIIVGEGAKIAAGSLVLKEVSPHTTVAGVPAKEVGKPTEDAPALAMEQGFNY